MKTRSSLSSSWTRRRVLTHVAGGVLATTAAPDLLFTRAIRAEGPAVKGPVPSKSRVRGLADALRLAPEDDVFAVAAKQISDGATIPEMLAATALAGVLDVSPRPAGTKFHVVLTVPAALALSRASKGTDAWLPVFFNLNVLKWSQRRDIAEGDWYLPEAPAPATDDPAKARALLTASMREWDDEAADRAAVAAARLLEPDDLFEILWPMGIRDFHNIGHKMIHTSQLYRALQLLDPGDREPVVRSLVWGLLGAGPGPSTAPYDGNRKRAAGRKDSPDAGRRDPQASREILSKLRSADADGAVAIVVELLDRGVAAESVWDGLRLFASELLFRLRLSDVHNAQLLGVHPLTIINAARFAWEKTTRNETRWLLLLQTAAWMPMARDVLREAKELSMAGPGIDKLPPSEGSFGIDQAIAAADDDAVRSAAMVLEATGDHDAADRFMARTAALVVQKAPEHHHYKYSVAAFEEYRRTDPRLAPYLLAPCLSYLPTPGDEVSPVVRRARAALKQV